MPARRASTCCPAYALIDLRGLVLAASNNSPVTSTAPRQRSTERAAAPRRASRLVAVTALWLAVALVVVFVFRTLLVLFAGVLFAISLAAVARWVSRISKLPYWLALTAIVVFGISTTI